MNNESKKAWESAYLEAYELAKKGNPVIQTAIARDVFQFDTEIIGFDEGYRLVKKAASAGYPPANFLQYLYLLVHFKDHPDEPLKGKYLFKALDSGNAEAKCFTAIGLYASRQIDAMKLCDELTENDESVMAISAAAVKRFISESEESKKTIQLDKAEALHLHQQMAASSEAHRHQIEGKNFRIRKLESEKKDLTKMAASLSASTLEKERDILRFELAETSQRLANADQHVAEIRRQLDASISEAVKEMKGQAEQTQLERDIAIEERDEALHHAENAERRAKHLEQFLRQHGLEPSMAFCNGMMAEERVLESGS